MVSALKDKAIWNPTNDNCEDYSEFYRLNYEIKDLLTQTTGQEITLWDIEHALWYINNKRSEEFALELQQSLISENQVPNLENHNPEPVVRNELPNSYIPPVISILPSLARNDPELASACVQQNMTIEKVFEDRLAILFEILGYESHSLGQGHGRVPDGIAISEEYHYAIIYDAKVRQNGYSMGIDDRAIREYISRQCEPLRRIGIRNIYFMIISNNFNGNNEAAIRRIKIETHVNEVILVEINALIVMVEMKLKNSMITLGPDGLQGLLAFSGVLTPNYVLENTRADR
jgi:hypothetical protein